MADPNDVNGDGSLSQYERDLAAWRAAKASGNPFPGPTPQPSAEEALNNEVLASGVDRSLANDQAAPWLDIARNGVSRGPRANPYDPAIANQNRAGQMALFRQMQAAQRGPSIAGTQAAQGLGQNAMAALAAQGRGSLGSRGVMGQQAGASAGIAQDAARARAMEMLNAQRGQFGLASGIRGADLKTAQDQAAAGLSMRGMDDKSKLFYTNARMGLHHAADEYGRGYIKLYNQHAMNRYRQQQDGFKQAINTISLGLIPK